MIILCFLAKKLADLKDCPDPDGRSQYRVPFVPYFPLFGTFANYFLVAQLSWFGLVMIFGYIALSILFYFTYGIKHSEGNNNGWSTLLAESARKSKLSEESVDDSPKIMSDILNTPLLYDRLDSYGVSVASNEVNNYAVI
jgi:hypothetical protein